MYRNKCAAASLAFQVTDQVTQSTKSSVFYYTEYWKSPGQHKACALPSPLFKPFTRVVCM